LPLRLSLAQTFVMFRSLVKIAFSFSIHMQLSWHHQNS
jgi:hypothetical protein